MSLFTAKCCCCCFSVRSGALLLGYFGLLYCFLGILAALQIHPEYVAVFLFPLLLFISLLYGIYKNASQWLLLNTIACVIGVCLLILGLIVCIVLIIMHLVMPINNENSPTLGPTYVLIFLVICPSIVIGWHFTAVIYTLYCQIKEENRHHLVVAYKADRKDTKRSTVEYEI